MDSLRVTEGPIVARHIIRAWDVPPELCPDDDREFARLWPLLERELGRPAIERENVITKRGFESLALYAARLGDALRSGKPYYQAIGTANYRLGQGNRNGKPVSTDTTLFQELYRKRISGLTVVSGGPSLLLTTYFTPTEVYSHPTKISSIGAGPPYTSITLASATHYIKVGMLLRIDTSAGYEFHAPSAIAGSVLTFPAWDSIAAAPIPNTQVYPVLTEGGVFGDEGQAAGFPGTVTITSGSPGVPGAGTGFSSTLHAADKIRSATAYNGAVNPPIPAQAGDWLDILSVGSATQLTLTANASYSAPGSAYAINGAMFNHVADLAYVKLSSRGFVYQNDWLFAGG
jgi:hypothetical protein